MGNIRASPSRKTRKRATPLEIRASEGVITVNNFSGEITNNYYQIDSDRADNPTSSSKIVPPKWWIIFGSISITSIITGIIFNEALIIPLMSIGFGITYLLIQTGNSIGMKHRIKFFAEFLNKLFSMKFSIHAEDDNYNRNNNRFFHNKN